MTSAESSHSSDENCKNDWWQRKKLKTKQEKHEKDVNDSEDDYIFEIIGRKTLETNNNKNKIRSKGNDVYPDNGKLQFPASLK